MRAIQYMSYITIMQSELIAQTIGSQNIILHDRNYVCIKDIKATLRAKIFMTLQCTLQDHLSSKTNKVVVIQTYVPPFGLHFSQKKMSRYMPSSTRRVRNIQWTTAFGMYDVLPSGSSFCLDKQVGCAENARNVTPKKKLKVRYLTAGF